ncbi:MAG: hypothetical protein Q8P67_06015 [archaeon]|nr:hypothetical protein [archaeon]
MTEYTSFRGQILCTEQTLEFGKQRMEELVSIYEAAATQRELGWASDEWRTAESLCTLPDEWLSPVLTLATEGRRLYTRQDVASCVSRVTVVACSEPVVSADGLLEARCHQSGFAIGAVNWVLETVAQQRLVYLGPSCLAQDVHPSPLVTHPLHGADLLLLAAPSPGPDLIRDPSSDRLLQNGLQELCRLVAHTVSLGGVALLPLHPSGPLFDVLERLAVFLNTSSYRPPIYLVSPAGAHSLAYANISGEALCPSRQARLFLPDHPFSHPDLIRDGQLRHFSTVSSHRHSHSSSANSSSSSSISLPRGISAAPIDLGDVLRSEAAVVIATHPSLRLGPVVQLLQLLGGSPRNSLLVTSPPEHLPLLDQMLAPFAPLAMRVHACPIDYRMPIGHAESLVELLAPRRVVVGPESARLVSAKGLFGTTQVPVLLAASREPLSVPLSASSVRGHIHERLAQQLRSPALDAGASETLIVPLCARLRASPDPLLPSAFSRPSFLLALADEGLNPSSYSSSSSSSSLSLHQRSLYGRPRLDQLLASFTAHGWLFALRRPEQTSPPPIPPYQAFVDLPSLSATVAYSPHHSKIVLYNVLRDHEAPVPLQAQMRSIESRFSSIQQVIMEHCYEMS